MSNVFKGFGINLSQNPVKIEMSSPFHIPRSAPIQEVEEEFEQVAVEQELPDPKELVADAARKAKEIIEQANAEMQAQKTAFEEELKTTLEMERQKAYELGLLDGAEKKSQEIEDAIATLTKSVAEIKENFNDFIDEQKSDLVTLVLEVCEKILAKRIEADDMVMMPIIQKALSDIKIKSHCAINVSEDASELVTFLKSELKKSKNSNSEMFDIVAKDMPVDFCVLEVDDSCLDISISTQFENLKNFLKHSE